MDCLSVLCPESPFELIVEGSRSFLNLPISDPDIGAEQLKAAASHLIDLVNGSARLLYRDFKPVSFVKISRIGKDGKRKGVGFLTAKDRSFSLTALNPRDQRVSNWVHSGLNHPEVGRALYLYGSLEPDWKNLYLVLEVIEENFGGERKLLEKEIVAADRIKLFKRTANSYRSIGRDARHAKMAPDPIKTPMTFNEAHELIRLLLQKWIELKIQSA